VSFDIARDDAFLVFIFAAAADRLAASRDVIFIGGFVRGMDSFRAAGKVAVAGFAVCFGNVDLGL